ncbi:hypothetical protein KGF54_000492 [Candida jiufengensis]|uniref:uncharacterized protein n=1 Tax=Candida jiufengensis TaxID=497108 RepID=UPI002224BAB8|nr:uncharacterized protein KGF54_000492 [Candida jiufengensis]KAI5956874.1 hypothetical protein KGF54_000492 [Candida jiufengensis]
MSSKLKTKIKSIKNELKTSSSSLSINLHTNSNSNTSNTKRSNSTNSSPLFTQNSSFESITSHQMIISPSLSTINSINSINSNSSSPPFHSMHRTRSLSLPLKSSKKHIAQQQQQQIDDFTKFQIDYENYSSSNSTSTSTTSSQILNTDITMNDELQSNFKEESIIPPLPSIEEFNHYYSHCNKIRTNSSSLHSKKSSINSINSVNTHQNGEIYTPKQLEASEDDLEFNLANNILNVIGKKEVDWFI